MLPIEAIWLLEFSTSNLQNWKATLLQGNQSHLIVDFGFYSDETIAILSKSAAGTPHKLFYKLEGNQELGISFYKYCELEEGLPYSPLAISSLKHFRAVDSLLGNLQFAQMVSQERVPFKSRIEANIEPVMFSISPARKRGGGVASIVANGRKLILFDLEADEEEEETENAQEIVEDMEE